MPWKQIYYMIEGMEALQLVRSVKVILKDLVVLFLTLKSLVLIPLELLLPNAVFKKLIIKHNAIRELRNTLELYSFNEYSIYQDLDALSKQLNRFVLERKVDGIETISVS